jgi:hypothetical protein
MMGAQVDNQPTSGLSPEQLARLLRLGARGGPGDDAAAAALPQSAPENERLDAVLAAEVADMVPAGLNRPCPELAPLAGRRLGEVLLDPRTDLAALRLIKDYGKHLSARTPSGPAHAVAVVVYYAAIAGALTFHGEKITDHAYDRLAVSLQMLIEKPWMPADLVRLLAAARDVCKAKAGCP